MCKRTNRNRRVAVGCQEAREIEGRERGNLLSPTLPHGQELLFPLPAPHSCVQTDLQPRCAPFGQRPNTQLGVSTMPHPPNLALLVTLRLSNNPLTTAGVGLLMDGLAGNTSVTHLSLLHTDLGDEGLELLAAQLDRNKQLQELNVAYNGAGDTVALALAKAAREHPSLELLQ